MFKLKNFIRKTKIYVNQDCWIVYVFSFYQSAHPYRLLLLSGQNTQLIWDNQQPVIRLITFSLSSLLDLTKFKYTVISLTISSTNILLPKNGSPNGDWTRICSLKGHCSKPIKLWDRNFLGSTRTLSLGRFNLPCRAISTNLVGMEGFEPTHQKGTGLQPAATLQLRPHAHQNLAEDGVIETQTYPRRFPQFSRLVRRACPVHPPVIRTIR